MSGNLNDLELNDTLDLDFDCDENARNDLSLLRSSDFDRSSLGLISLNETFPLSDPLTVKEENKDIIESTTTEPVDDNTNETSSFNFLEYYYNVLKPLCPNLENSFGELFDNTKVKGRDFAKAFVAKRVALAVEKAKKSLSCSHLSNVNESLEKSHNISASNGTLSSTSFRRSLNDIHSTTFTKPPANTTKIMNDYTENHSLYSGSVEALNNPQISNETFTKLNKNNTFEVDGELTTHKLRKSVSFSGFSEVEIRNNESLLDIELKLEDSIPSEDEVDEMGLPVKKLFINRTPSKKQTDLSKTLKKFKKIIRASFGKPSEDTDNINTVENEATSTASNSNNVEIIKDLPLLPVQQDCNNIQLKKASNKVSSKGPMKAFVPLQSMTKQNSAEIMSPLKEKKEKKMDSSLKTTSHFLSESFDDKPPIAASTPSSEGKASRGNSMKSMNSSRRRSLSEGRTPVKKTGDFTFTKEGSLLQRQPALNNTKTLSCDKKEKKRSIMNSTVTTKSLLHSSLPKQKAVSNSGPVLGLRRPSSAPVKLPVSAKPQIPTKLKAGNQPSDNQTKMLQPTRASSSGLSFCKPNKTKKELSVQATALKTFNTIDKRSVPVLLKTRRLTSALGKENK